MYMYITMSHTYLPTYLPTYISIDLAKHPHGRPDRGSGAAASLEVLGQGPGGWKGHRPRRRDGARGHGEAPGMRNGDPTGENGRFTREIDGKWWILTEHGDLNWLNWGK